MSQQQFQIPATFASCLVIPKDESEKADAKMPKDVFNAVIVLKQAGKDSEAEVVVNCMNRYLKILADGPDGKTQVHLGRGAFCWACGHVGLPRNAEAVDSDPTGSLLPVCGKCTSDEETNFVELVQPDGSKLPWIEVAILATSS